MKKTTSFLSTLSFLTIISLFSPGCAAIGGIFKAGVWVGVLAVVFVVVIIMFFVSKAGKK